MSSQYRVKFKHNKLLNNDLFMKNKNVMVIADLGRNNKVVIHCVSYSDSIYEVFSVINQINKMG